MLKPLDINQLTAAIAEALRDSRVGIRKPPLTDG